MFDQRTLARYITKDDLVVDPSLSTRDQLAAEAARVAGEGLASIPLTPIIVRNRIAYKSSSIAHSVVLRRLNHAFRYISKIVMSDRDSIIRQIGTVLSEGVHHSIFKLDIQNFFECIDRSLILAEAYADHNIPRQYVKLLQGFDEALKALGISGLPRGLSISSTLSEYLMQDFDRNVSRIYGVYYYSRFVDDILVIADGPLQATVQSLLFKSLPKPLRFNNDKTKLVDARDFTSKTPAFADHFDYLGYRFEIRPIIRLGDNRLVRTIAIKIAPRKIARIKSRLCRAFLDFTIKGDFPLLVDRIKILTGNHSMYNRSAGETRNIGLRFSYQRITETSGLRELDSFYRSIVCGNRTKMGKKVGAVLSSNQRRLLLRFTFEGGFTNIVFYHFNARRVSEVRRCWIHV